MQLSNRQEFLQSDRNLDWKMTPHHENHSGSLCSQGCNSQAQSWFLARFVTLQIRHQKLSRDTKIIENRHWVLRQPCAGKLTKVRKLCWKSDTFFHLGDHFRVQSLPNSLELVQKSGTLRNKITSATTCNSRFVGNISGLGGIFAGKTQKN